MAFGDSDLKVFCAETGAVVSFGSQPDARGNFDNPSKPAMFGELSVSATRPSLVMPYNAFDPMPAVEDELTVDGVPYTVRESNPMVDGKLVELALKEAF